MQSVAGQSSNGCSRRPGLSGFVFSLPLAGVHPRPQVNEETVKECGGPVLFKGGGQGVIGVQLLGGFRGQINPAAKDVIQRDNGEAGARRAPHVQELSGGALKQRVTGRPAGPVGRKRQSGKTNRINVGPRALVGDNGGGGNQDEDRDGYERPLPLMERLERFGYFADVSESAAGLRVKAARNGAVPCRASARWLPAHLLTDLKSGRR